MPKPQKPSPKIAEKTASKPSPKIAAEDPKPKSTLPTKAAPSALSTINMEKYANAGMENVNAARDLTIPRLTILQALSPQVKKEKPEFIKGAQVGQICDTAIQKLWDESIEFLPVHFKVQWLEWAPRSSGKGLIAIHDDNSILEHCEKDEKGRNITDSGNLVVETATFMGFNLSEGGRRCFISLSSTQRKKAKKLLDLATSERLKGANGEFVPPLFYRSYTMSVVPESNNEGDWYGWRIERSKALPEMGEEGAKLFQEAVRFRDSIEAGNEKIDTSAMDDTAHSANSSDDDEM